MALPSKRHTPLQSVHPLVKGLLSALLIISLLTSCLPYRVGPLKTVALPKRFIKGVEHPVKKKETLWRICKTYRVDLQEVAEINNIKDPADIKVGQKIFIPGATKVLKIAVPKEEKRKRKKPTIVQKKGRFAWPVKGKVVGKFGTRGGKRYAGIDIAAPLGTPVKASASGKVAYSATLEGYGNLIIIQHADKYTTVYGNNQVNLVKTGKWVKKGATIAKVGKPERERPVPSLHFQIRRYNKSRNPLFYLP